ncbi:MAG: hypothetical protein KatS3mg027_1990 [Bacteroidia bacterium]|nr:MAG: hypothetical protein KatS3mg027_1990 [Bacteroidia bacterium]
MHITKLPYLKLVFENSFQPYEVDKLRDIAISLTKGHAILYHNHIENKFNYDYPLIQYKIISNKGAILYLHHGIEHIHYLFNQLEESKGKIKLKLQKIFSFNYSIVSNGEFEYELLRWLPLYDEYYEEFKQLELPEEKEIFLKIRLKDNILTFLRGIDFNFTNNNDKIEIQNFQILKEDWISFKDVKFKYFNVKFKTNIFLPPHIGLGKGAAKNYGVVFPQKHPSKIVNKKI